MNKNALDCNYYTLKVLKDDIFFNIMCTSCQLQWFSYVSHQHHASYHVLITCFWSDFFIRVGGDALPGRNHCQAKHQCLRPLQPKKGVILATVRTYRSCLCGTKNWYMERRGNFQSCFVMTNPNPTPNNRGKTRSFSKPNPMFLMAKLHQTLSTVLSQH